MEPTKGYKSSEFYLSLAAMIIGALMASGLFAVDSIWMQILGGAMGMLSAMGYTLVRGFTKSSTAKAAAIASLPKNPT